MKENAREIVAFAIVALFSYSLIRNPHEPLIVGAMIAAFSTAYGFYLGGSKVGSDTATKNAETVSRAAQGASDGPTGTPTDPLAVEEVNK